MWLGQAARLGLLELEQVAGMGALVEPQPLAEPRCLPFRLMGAAAVKVEPRRALKVAVAARVCLARVVSARARVVLLD
jgi:hypothetical protein